jgi:hypothetical protein
MDGRDALEVHASTFSRLGITCITIGFQGSRRRFVRCTEDQHVYMVH